MSLNLLLINEGRGALCFISMLMSHNLLIPKGWFARVRLSEGIFRKLFIKGFYMIKRAAARPREVTPSSPPLPFPWVGKGGAGSWLRVKRTFHAIRIYILRGGKHIYRIYSIMNIIGIEMCYLFIYMHIYIRIYMNNQIICTNRIRIWKEEDNG